MKIGMKALLILLVWLSMSLSAFALNKNAKIFENHEYATNELYPNYQEEVSREYLRLNHFEIIAALGINGVNMSDGHLKITSSETDTLKQTNSNNWNAWLGQLGVGYIFPLINKHGFPDGPQWFPSIEPMLNLYLTRFNIKGDILRFNSPNFNEFSYKSTIQSTRLMLDVALTVLSKQQFSLYALAGIGESWNRISYKDPGASSACPLAGINLDSKDRYRLAWDLGAGIAYAFNPVVSLSLEYLYTNLGTLGTSDDGDTGNITAPRLGVAHASVDTQALLLGLHIALG